MTEYEKLKGIIDKIDDLISHHVRSSAPAFETWYTKAERFLIKEYGEDYKLLYKPHPSALPDEEQEKSIIYYEDTYMQNSGVDYGTETEFEVISILEGTVINVKEDDLTNHIMHTESYSIDKQKE